MPAIAPINWVRIAILGLIFGAAFMATKLALQTVGPYVIVASRVTLGAIFLVILSYTVGTGLPTVRGRKGRIIWAFALAMGVFSNALPFALLTWGQQSVASGFAGVCMAIVPLLILPLAWLVVPGETMNFRKVVGFVTGTIGVIVLIGPGAFESTGDAFEIWARLACVAAAGCYAIGAIFTRLCPDVDRLALAAATLLLAAVIFTPFALLHEGLPTQVSGLSFLALLYLGILPTGVAQILLVQVIRDAGPVFMSLVNYQVPVWSVVFGVVLLSEPLPPSLLSAMVLLLTGLLLSQLGALRRLFLRGEKQRNIPRPPTPL